MLESAAPHAGNVTLDGNRKAIYERGADGRLRIVPSSGSEIEEIVTLQAVDEYRRLASEARAQARAGLASPLLYHMYRARMDLPVLAQSVGVWRWRVRRHLTAPGFAKLSPRLMQRYARALDISVEELRSLD